MNVFFTITAMHVLNKANIISSIFIIIILIGIIPAPATAIDEPPSEQSVDSLGLDTQSFDLRSEIDQRVRINPRSNVTLTPGQNYTVSVITGVDTGTPLITKNSVSEPDLNVSVSAADGSQPKITGIVSPKTAYDVQKNKTSSTSYLLHNDKFFAGSIHRTMVRIYIPKDVTEVTIAAQTGRKGGDDTDTNSQDSVEYSVAQPDDRWEEMARLAESRAQTANSLSKKYSSLINGSSVETVVDRGMAQTFFQSGLFIKDIYSLQYSGSKLSKVKDATKIGKQFSGYYKSTKSDKKFDGPWVGPIIKAENRMLRDGRREIQLNRVERAGDTKYLLDKLSQLAQKEEAAWRNHNRAKAIKNLKKQYEILTWEDQSNIYVKSKDGDLLQTGEFLPYQAHDQQRVVSFDRNDLVNRGEYYFGGVKQYASESATAIETVVLPVVDEPKPRVRLDNREYVKKQLSTNGTFNATIVVSNGGGGGSTSQQGYLSVVVSEDTLKIRDVTQLDDRSDPEKPKSNIITGDTTVLTRGGDRQDINGTLLDIYEQYDTGEKNVYNITLNRNKANTSGATFTYRTAFEPAIHDTNSQSLFVRRPTENIGTRRGQQGWYVYEVANESDTSNIDPSTVNAEISFNETVQVGQKIVFNASDSTSSRDIRSYGWDLDDDGEYERFGETVDKTFTNETVYDHNKPTVRLRVTNVVGNTDYANVSFEVKSGVEVNLTSVELNKSSTFRNQPVRINTTITNNGTEQGDYDLRPVFNKSSIPINIYGERVKSGSISPGESIRISWRVRSQATGKWKISVYDFPPVGSTLSDTLTVRSKPTVELERPNNIVEGEQVSFSLEESRDADGSISEYQWDLNNDGEFERSGPVQTLTFNDPGVETFRLRLVDNDGYTVTHQHQLLVNRHSDWPSSGRTPGREAAIENAPAPKSNISVAWQQDLNESQPYYGKSLKGAPIVVNDTVYTGVKLISKGQVTAFDRQTGAVEWSKTIPSEVSDSPVAYGNTLLVPVYRSSKSNALVAFDRHTGNRLWTQDTEGLGDRLSSPAVVNGIAYTASGDAIDITSGELIWSYGADAYGVSVNNGRVVFPSFALDATDGSVLWRRDITGYHDPAVNNGTMFTGLSNVTAIDTTTGQTIWKTQVGDEDSWQQVSPAVGNGMVYVSTGPGTGSNITGHLYGLNASTGNIEWNATYPNYGRTNPIVVNGTVYVGSQACEETCGGIYTPDGIIWAFDAETGEKYWSYRVDGLLQSDISVSDENLYTGNGRGKLIALTGDSTAPRDSDGGNEKDITISDVQLKPTTVGSQGNHNLSFTVSGVSADNQADNISITLPDSVNVMSVDEARSPDTPYDITIGNEGNPIELSTNPDRPTDTVEMEIKVILELSANKL